MKVNPHQTGIWHFYQTDYNTSIIYTWQKQHNIKSWIRVAFQTQFLLVVEFQVNQWHKRVIHNIKRIILVQNNTKEVPVYRSKDVDVTFSRFLLPDESRVRHSPPFHISLPPGASSSRENCSIHTSIPNIFKLQKVRKTLGPTTIWDFMDSSSSCRVLLQRNTR